MPEKQNVRLNSWKEITTYLDHDVRTVIRWEKERGMPVHRVPGGKGHGVFAYSSEIEAWLSNAGVAADPQARLQAQSTADRDRSILSPFDQEKEKGAMARSKLKRWSLAAGLSLLLLIVGISAWRSVRPLGRHFGWGGPTLRQIAVMGWPLVKLSPDSRWVAYQDSESRHIFLKNIESGEGRVLVAEEAGPWLVWSCDSRQLLFCTFHTGSTRQFEAVDMANGTRKIIWTAPPGSDPVPHDWSADGSQILFTVDIAEGKRQISLLPLKEGKLSPIVTVPPQSNWPQLSPDGRFVAYASARNNNWDIFLAPVREGATEMRLTDHPARDFFPFWSHDGRTLTFLSERRGSADLWAFNIDPQKGTTIGAPLFLTNLGPRASVSSVSNSGELLFTRRRRTSQAFLLDVDPISGVPQGSPRSSFDEDTFTPVWSRDGRKLFFEKLLPEGTFPLLTERDLRTGTERTIHFPSSHHLLFLAPSPDGETYAFFGWDQSGQKGIYVYDPKTERVMLLCKTELHQNPPLSWSPDGSRLLFSSAPQKDERLAVEVLDVSDGKLHIVAWSWSRPFPQWSPDGREIAYTDANCLMVVPSNGGIAQQLTCARPVEAPGFDYLGLGGLSWSPDGRKLAWTVIDPDPDEKRVEMWIVDRFTGQHQAWLGEEHYKSWPSDPQWSPTGRQIAFQMNFRREYEVWLLKDFLP